MDELKSIIVWFQRDLRLNDNPSLHFALEQKLTIIPLFIIDDENETIPLGGTTKWWLCQSLKALDAKLKKKGSRLIVKKGRSEEIISQIAHLTNAKLVTWNKRFEPKNIEFEKKIALKLDESGIETKSFNASSIVDPLNIINNETYNTSIFTHFYNSVKDHIEIMPELKEPSNLPPPPFFLETLNIDALGLEPKFNWATGIKNRWDPGEDSANLRLNHFIEKRIAYYGKERDRLDKDVVSMLSSHIHFGEISARTIYRKVKEYENNMGFAALSKSIEVYVKELFFREFAQVALLKHPQSYKTPIRDEYHLINSKKNYKNELHYWKCGLTGYPIVDAAMRELWIYGWISNRARMIVASFLTKDLLIPWQEGFNWFWDTLVDADLANNSFGWGWVCGTGTDAVNYIRVFNPVIQSEKFDPSGEYIRRFIPEIAHLNDKKIHAPWKASALDLEIANIKLGVDYPYPIVDHEKATKQALNIFSVLKK
jgi:deoxyribodipyrimidine photo-lyase